MARDAEYTGTLSPQFAAELRAWLNETGESLENWAKLAGRAGADELSGDLFAMMAGADDTVSKIADATDGQA